MSDFEDKYYFWRLVALFEAGLLFSSLLKAVGI